MPEYVEIVDVGKEKSISNRKAKTILQEFINANSGNENDTFDESRIVGFKAVIPV